MAKILVVDDDVTITKMLREILEADEHTVTTVYTGHDGVKAFSREPFDLVVQDVNLPGGVSGYGACQSYKSLRDTVAVIMMTGEFLSDQDEAIARRLGADGFLRKPFSLQLLLREVTEALEARAMALGALPIFTCRGCEAQFPVLDPIPHDSNFRVACSNCGRFTYATKGDLVWERPEERKGPQDPDALRVLVVQDNENYRQFLAFLLNRAGHVVLESSNGREGLNFSKQWEPHVVITDVMLPDLDGITMSQKIREDPKTAKVPIMILTSFQRDTFQQQARDLGVTYLAKPIQPEALLEALTSISAG